jgi:hypothetical protein
MNPANGEMRLKLTRTDMISSESEWRCGAKVAAAQRLSEFSIGIARDEEGDLGIAFSYTREELAGGPLLKGRRKRGATMRGEA